MCRLSRKSDFSGRAAILAEVSRETPRAVPEVLASLIPGAASEARCSSPRMLSIVHSEHMQSRLGGPTDVLRSPADGDASSAIRLEQRIELGRSRWWIATYSGISAALTAALDPFRHCHAPEVHDAWEPDDATSMSLISRCQVSETRRGRPWAPSLEHRI